MAWALAAGGAVWTVACVIGFVIYGTAAAGAQGARAGIMAGAFVAIPIVLGVATVVSMLRGNRKAVKDTQRKRAELAATQRAHQAEAAEDQRRAELTRREQERADVIWNQKVRQQKLADGLRECVSLVVASFNDLPVRLEQAARARDEARRHFGAGAYSPFWSAIEESLGELSGFRSRVDAIESNVNRYRGCLSSYRAGPDTSTPVPSLPAGLEVLSETSAAQSIAADVYSLTYEAQRDPVFAQIWEQRRTTAATVEGFGNIEAAMQGMSSQISASIQTLQGTIVGVGFGLASEIQRSREAAEAHSRDAVQSADGASELLSSTVYYLREADRREGGSGSASWDRGRI